MATTNHVVLANIPAVTPGNAYFNQIWSLTRALLKSGWKYLASSLGSVDTTGMPEADKWRNPAAVVRNGTGATITAPSRGRATVTGLSGVIAKDKGRFLRFTGETNTVNNHDHPIEEIVDSTSVRIAARGEAGSALVVPEGGLFWAVYDPTTEVYPSALAGSSCWWAARGPSMLKVPIGSGAVTRGPSGYALIRGENLVQAGSGAEGEVVGVVEDVAGGAGYLVVAPRVRGTDVGAYGWAPTGTLSGSLTGASVTTAGTVLEYRAEMLLWKAANANTGSIFFNVIEPVVQAAESFGALATQTGCTATVAPGGGGTNNAFPAHAWVAFGQSTSGSHLNWSCYTAPTIGNAQILVADAIEEAGYSADGSFVFAAHDTTLTGGGHISGFGFQRCDDSEDGDVFPYVSLATFQNAGSPNLYENNRTSTGGQGASMNGDKWQIANVTGAFGAITTAGRRLAGWRRLGLTGESFQDFEPVVDYALASSARVMSSNGASPAIDASAPTTRKKREPIRVVSVQLNSKMHKGSLRWIGVVQGGNGHDTYDNKQWIQLSPSSSGACVAGPWDGVTVPAAV